MQIAIVAAGFTPSEADRLRRAMATFKRVGTIHRFRGKFIDGMVANGYAAEFAERCFQQIEGFGTYGFPGIPRRELRAAGLRLVLAQVPLPGGVRLRAAQQPADGLLRAGADRARRARPRRRGAAGRRQRQRLGLHARGGGATPVASPRTRSPLLSLAGEGEALWPAAAPALPLEGEGGVEVAALALRLGFRQVKGLQGGGDAAPGGAARPGLRRSRRAAPARRDRRRRARPPGARRRLRLARARPARRLVARDRARSHRPRARSAAPVRLGRGPERRRPSRRSRCRR